jgi:DNA polymerase-3 subunit alpha
LREICSQEPPNRTEKKFKYKQKEIKVAGLIADIKKRGNRTTVILDDDTARIDTVFFNDNFIQNKEFLKKDKIIIVEGKLRFDEFSSSWQVNADTVRFIDDVITEKAKLLTIQLNGEYSDSDILEKIRQILKITENGNCQVAINYENKSAKGRVNLGDDWNVNPTSELRENLSSIIGRDSFNLSY